MYHLHSLHACIRCILIAFAIVTMVATPSRAIQRVDDPWPKHVVYEGANNMTAVGADFTGDGKTDVITTCGGFVRLFVAPSWTEKRIFQGPNRNWTAIHSEVMDVDDDGDPDYIGAIAVQGVFWLENPADSGNAAWQYHNIDDEIHGIHCTLKADVDLDQRFDLLVNNFEPHGAAPNSLTWLRIPPNPRQAPCWTRNVLADGDAPGGNHYFGFGDVDGDGRPDVCVGAKGQPFQHGNWFAWWKNPGRPTQTWAKQVIARNETGATNIAPADINGDGIADFVASRGHGQGVVWYEGPKWRPHEIDPTLDGPHCLQVLDIDGDGDIDAATCAKLDKLAVWYENDGRGRFTARVVGKDQAAYDIRVLDMDADKDLDFLIAGQSSGNVVWYENPGRKRGP